MDGIYKYIYVYGTGSKPHGKKKKKKREEGVKRERKRHFGFLLGWNYVKPIHKGGKKGKEDMRGVTPKREDIILRLITWKSLAHVQPLPKLSQFP